jgi:hypothetical protein
MFTPQSSQIFAPGRNGASQTGQLVRVTAVRLAASVDAPLVAALLGAGAGVVAANGIPQDGQMPSFGSSMVSPQTGQVIFAIIPNMFGEYSLF